MTSKDFNLELDSYISKVREKRTSPVASKSKKTKYIREEKVPKEISRSTSIYVIKKPKSGWQKVKEKFSDVSEVDYEKRKTTTKSNVGEQQEFDQEYDEMKKEGKKSGFFSWLSNIFADDVDDSYKEMDDEKMAVSKGEQTNKTVKTTPPATDIDDDTNVRTEKRSGFISRLSYIFGLTPDEEESANEGASKAVIDEVKADLKTVATISIETFKKLPKAEFTRLKNSPEFAKFKEILKKHGIVKDK